MDSEEAREQVIAALDSCGPEVPAWSDTQVAEAFAGVRRPQLVDADGLAPVAVAIVAAASPWLAGSAIRALASSSAQMRGQTVRGVPLGKRSSTPEVGRVRMLLPQGTILMAPDVLIAAALTRTRDALDVPSGFWEGGRQGVRNGASYVAQAARLVFEKGLDSGSAYAVLQTDIATFYDRVNVVQAAQVARASGLPLADAAAAIRHQLMPEIQVLVPGGERGIIRARTCGALTGSRTAGALGRFVVHELARHICLRRSASALRVGESSPMLLASYIDHLLVVGPDASAAEGTFVACNEYLQRAWRLDLPAGSTEALVPRGAVRAAAVREVLGMKLLGH